MPIVSLRRGSETDPNSPGCLNRLLLLLRGHFKWLLGPSFAVRLVLRIRVLDSYGSRNYDAVQTIQLTDSQIFLIRHRDLYGPNSDTLRDLTTVEYTLLLPSCLLMHFARGLVLVLRARIFRTIATVEGLAVM